jgi:hypothetical protein
LGSPVTTCAQLAGYSKAYGQKLISKYKHNPKLRNRIDEIAGMMPERFRTLTQPRLATICEIEGAALQKYLDSPELAINKPKLLRDMKIAARALEPDAPRQPSINVGTIQVIQQSIREDLANKDSDKAIDVTSQPAGRDEDG